VEPAGYAFVIWGLIYAGSLAYAVYQARPAKAEDPLLRRIGWLTASGFLLTCIWMLVARFGPLWATVPTIIGMLSLLGASFVVAARWDHRQQALTRSHRWLVITPLAIFNGWLTAAVFVNAAEVLPRYGFGRLGLPLEAFSLVVLGAAFLLALVVLRLARWNPAYGITVVWALLGIIVANIERELSFVVAIAAGCAAVALLAVLALKHEHRRALVTGGPTRR
jgi:hypothetical protein